jgi:hypothetical protein
VDSVGIGDAKGEEGFDQMSSSQFVEQNDELGDSGRVVIISGSARGLRAGVGGGVSSFDGLMRIGG